MQGSRNVSKRHQGENAIKRFGCCQYNIYGIDKRRIVKTWWFTNRLGETFQFAQVGRGKDSYIKTLRSLRPRE
jgi:hypothetical protein